MTECGHSMQWREMNRSFFLRGEVAEAEVETWQICIVAVQAIFIIFSPIARLHAEKSLNSFRNKY